MFLSQPPIITTPSYPIPTQTVSIESAITSLEISDNFIPSVPIDIPSDIVIVLKIIPLPPVEFTPFSASRANLSMCILQGVTLAHVDAIPT